MEVQTFKPQDRLKAYQAMAETSRKWATVMDSKAGFVSALNAALLGFAWSGARFSEQHGWPLWIALLATAASLASLGLALSVILPRGTLVSALRQPIEYDAGFKPVSYYGFVASNYPSDKAAQFVADVRSLDEDALANEALEQHYTISHLVQTKSNLIARAGKTWVAAMTLVALAMIVKEVIHGC